MNARIQINDSAVRTACPVSSAATVRHNPWRRACCVALLIGGSLAASAQTTLVSNLGQGHASHDYRSIGSSGTDFLTVGIRFTTGSSGATVDKFTLAFDAPGLGSPSMFKLDLYSGFTAGVGPSGHLATFTGADPVTAGNFDFVGTATLSGNTSYFLIASAPDTASSSEFSWFLTTSTAEDVSGLSGWSIGDQFIANNINQNWTESLSGSMMFSAQSSAVPEPSTYAVWAGIVALGGGFWRRRSVAGRSVSAIN